MAKVKRIKLIRIQAGATLDEMASIVGISKPQLSQIEQGWIGKVNERLNEKLIRVFGESFDWLTQDVEYFEPRESAQLLKQRHVA